MKGVRLHTSPTRQRGFKARPSLARRAGVGGAAQGGDMRAGKAVGHLDADCFYISAERVRNSFLLGKPVGVLGNQGAFVIAKSYEMKKLGVKTGEPIWDALPKCPQGIY